jgi:hypothetical protein
VLGTYPDKFALLYDPDYLELKTYDWHSDIKSLADTYPGGPNDEDFWDELPRFDIRTPNVHTLHSDKTLGDVIIAYRGDLSAFTANANIAVITFTAVTGGTLGDAYVKMSAVLDPMILSVQISNSSGGGTANYTITPEGEADATVGTPFNVDVKLTADPITAPYDGVYAELEFDSTLVSPGTLPGNVTRDGNKLLITRTPTGSDSTVGTGVTLATIPFTPNGAGDAVFSISGNASITLSGTSGDETDADPGADLTVTIAAGGPVVAYNNTYKGLPSGYTLLMYKLDAKPAVVWTYDGNAMHYVYTGGNHYVTYIVEVSVKDGTPSTPVPTSTPAVATADVNGNNKVSIGDAQIAADLIAPHTNYASLDALSIAARLAADVNNDGLITQDDVNLVIAAIHNGGNLPG